MFGESSSLTSFSSGLMPLDDPSGALRARPAMFGVVQYNALAQRLATPRHFPYVVPTLLSWRRRRAALLKEMLALRAHVYCCEELSEYWEFFRPQFEKRGFASVYLPRPSSSSSSSSGAPPAAAAPSPRGRAENGGCCAEGCAVFWRRDCFELVRVHPLVYSGACEHPSEPFRHVALAVELRHVRTRRRLVAACTQLHWDARAHAIQARASARSSTVPFFGGFTRGRRFRHDTSS